jgi:hypothetical protein
MHNGAHKTRPKNGVQNRFDPSFSDRSSRRTELRKILMEAGHALFQKGDSGGGLRKYLQAEEYLEVALLAALHRDRKMLGFLQAEKVPVLAGRKKYFDVVGILMLNGEPGLADRYKKEGIPEYRFMGMPWCIIAMHMVTGDVEAAKDVAYEWVPKMKKTRRYEFAVLMARLINENGWANKLAMDGIEYSHSIGTDDNYGVKLRLIMERKDGNFEAMVAVPCRIMNILKANSSVPTHIRLRGASRDTLANQAATGVLEAREGNKVLPTA